MPAHNFSAPARTVDELRAGLSGGSFGKGSTAEQGEASALMEAIERYSGIFQGDEIRVDAAVHGFPGRRCHCAERRPAVQRRAVCASRRRRPTGRVPSAPAPVRSIGQDRMVAGLVAARPALQISSDQPPVFFLPRPRRDQRGFQRLRGRQHARGSNRPGFPRAGGTGCLRNLVVQSIAAAASRPRPVRRFLHPRSAEPACRNRTPALGARRHQRSRDSELRGDPALDARTPRKISSSGPARISTRASPCCAR